LEQLRSVKKPVCGMIVSEKFRFYDFSIFFNFRHFWKNFSNLFLQNMFYNKEKIFLVPMAHILSILDHWIKSYSQKTTNIHLNIFKHNFSIFSFF
jgi:hypothetical protein